MMSFGYSKLETPVLLRTLKLIKELGPWLVRTWMGDHLGVGRGCCNYKHYEIPKAEKRGSSLYCMYASGPKKKNLNCHMLYAHFQLNFCKN